MDSAIFIRNRCVWTAWIAVPLLAALALEVLSTLYYTSQRQICLQRRALDQTIPEMTSASGQFDVFAAGFSGGSGEASGLEDRYIALLNGAAEKARFQIGGLSLVRKADDALGTVKVSLDVSGTGSGRSLVAFLQNIKKADPMFYEETIEVVPAVAGANLQLKGRLSKVLVGSKGGVL